MPYCTNNGVRSYYEVSGEGPAMVLIHANPYDHNLFFYQIAHFSTWFKVIAVDTRGYGRSDIVTTPYTLGDMAADAFAICRQEGVESAIVGGVSVGSGIAMLMALDRPDFCRACILVGGSSEKAKEPQDPPETMRLFLEQGRRGRHRSYIEGLVAPSFPKTPMGRYLFDVVIEKGEYFGWTAEGICEVMRARRGTNLTARLPTMKVPTLVINGEYDNSLRGGTRTASLVPGARHVILKGAGHACNIEDPAAFDAAVLAFLKDHKLLPA